MVSGNEPFCEMNWMKILWMKILLLRNEKPKLMWFGPGLNIWMCIYFYILIITQPARYYFCLCFACEINWLRKIRYSVSSDAVFKWRNQTDFIRIWCQMLWFLLDYVYCLMHHENVFVKCCLSSCFVIEQWQYGWTLFNSFLLFFFFTIWCF